jgi:predicted GNAT family acetyltransferase
MILDPARFRPASVDGVVRLGPEDADAVERLFADGDAADERPHFYHPVMLAEGVYCGVREGDDLVSAAGTHLVIPTEGVGAVGNVYTRRDRRGQGLAGRVTSAVTAELIRRGLRTIALNVVQSNAPAVHIYEKLGYVRYCAFCEGLAERI